MTRMPRSFYVSRSNAQKNADQDKVLAAAAVPSGELGYATQGVQESTTANYINTGSPPQPLSTATRTQGLTLPIVVPTAGMYLRALVYASASAAAVQVCVGIWDGNTELDRNIRVAPDANSFLYICEYRMPPGDGVTIHDIHVRYGVRQSTAGTVTLNAVSTNNQHSRLIARVL